MRQLLLLILLLHALSSATAQSNGVSIGGKWADQVSISDVNGRPFEKKYDDVNGHPFFDAVYKPTTIVLASGLRFVNIKTRINLVEQVTVFITSNGIEAYMETGSVKEISYADTTAAGIITYTFQTGFPAVDNLTPAHFYQVLAAGHCTLLKSIVKSVTERKNELSGEVSRDMETTETIYIFTNGHITRVKKDRIFLLGLLADKKELLDRYMEKEKINLKNTDQLIKLVNYYNSL